MNFRSLSIIALSGLCVGLFGSEALIKTKHIFIFMRPIIIILGMGAIAFGWLSYSRVISKTYNLKLNVTYDVDSSSYSPLILTALMLARSYWTLPRLGTLLIISAGLMVIWIKLGQWRVFRRGYGKVGGWTYAIPFGFAAALVWQMRWPDLNLPRYLIMGQLFGVMAGVAYSLIAKLKPQRIDKRLDKGFKPLV